MLSIADGRRTVVVQGGTYGRYLTDGYLTYMNQGALFALAFDLERMTTRGSAVAVLDDVAYSSTFGFAHLDIARNGTLVYRRALHGALVVSILDGAGRVEPLLASPGDYTFPRISPDARQLALAVTESGAQRLLMYDIHASRSSRLPADTATYGATWTPDSRFLVTGGPSGLRWIDARKGEAFAPLTRSTRMQIPWSFTRDGTRLAYYEMGETTGLDVWTVPVAISDSGMNAGEPEPFLTTRAFEGYPSFSSDGRWLAYSGGEYGRHIYVRPFPNDGSPAVEVSKGGGRIPAWLPGGRELLYRSEDHRLMVVAFTVRDGVFTPAAPRAWSPTQLADTGVLANFDIHPDGTRVVGLVPALSGAEQPRSHATFVRSKLQVVTLPRMVSTNAIKSSRWWASTSRTTSRSTSSYPCTSTFRKPAMFRSAAVRSWESHPAAASRSNNSRFVLGSPSRWSETMCDATSSAA